MREPREDIDKLFEDKLNNRLFDVPNDFLTDLENKLDQLPNSRKKKRAGFWFFLPLLAILGFSGAVFWLLNGVENKQVVKKEVIYQSRQQNANSRQVKQKNENSKRSNHIDTTNFEMVTAEIINSELSIQSVAEIPASKNDSKRGKQESSMNTSIVENPTFKQAARGRKGGANKHINETNPNYDDAKSKPTNTENGKYENAVVKSKNSQKNLYLELKLGELNEMSNSSEVATIKDNAMPDEDTLKNEILKELVVIRDSIVIRDSVRIRDSIVIRTVQSDNASLSHNSPWKVELQIGAGFTGTSVAVKTNDVEYQNFLNSSEKILFSPTLGFSANVFYNNWTAGLGAYYTQDGERTNYDLAKVIQSDSVFVDYYLQDSVWNPNSQQWDLVETPVYDTITVSDTISGLYADGNRYNWISVPLVFGYSFVAGKWNIIPRLGVTAEFGLSNRAGTYPKLNQLDFDLLSPAKFRLGYTAQVEFRRNINNWYVFANPYYRSGFVPNLRTEYMDRRYHNWGVLFGLGIRFN